MAHPARSENSEQDTEPRRGPKRDARGRVSGGNPGNSGGKKGRSGRKPNAFKEFLRAEVRDNPESRAALVEASQDPKLRAFSAAWKLATDYDDEKPAEKHTIVGPIEVRVRIEREGRRITAS